MSLVPLRYCTQKMHMNNVLSITNICHRSYAKDKGTGCKDIAQTLGRQVEVCQERPMMPGDPIPPNSDPYRIKVHDMVVPPLPPCNAKPAFDCKLCKSACSPKPAPEPPPCPKPPPPPFPWHYLWMVLSFCAAVGLIYKIYLWREEQERLGESKAKWRPRRKNKKPYHPQDLPACVQYLIIGAGTAGWSAYRAIKEHDKTAKVFFITCEDAYPYRRPPMSKQMWWNPEPPDIKTLTYVDGTRKTMYYAHCKEFMDPVKFYRKKTGPAVSIATGWCVASLDADDHVVYVKTVCGDQPIYYERCLLAPGSRPKNLSVFTNAPRPVRKKVRMLRSIRDLESAYRSVKKSQRVVVVGGGFLGSELAWHLGRMNAVVERNIDEQPIDIVHIYKDKGILGSILPEYLGEWGAEKIRCEGVTMMPKTQVYDAFMTKDGRIELTLSTGKSVVADYILVAVGNEPRDDLATSDLELDPVNGGFLVNTELEARTHLYVAGDAASYYSQWKDTRYRVEHYNNAEEQGFIAGANMTGFWTPCNMEPNYEFKLGDELQMHVSATDVVCHACWMLINPDSENPTPRIIADVGSEHSQSTVGHRHVCINCGRSLLRIRFHQLTRNTVRESHIYSIISAWITPQEVVGEVGACMPTIAMFKDCAEDEKIQAQKPKKGNVVAKEKPCYQQSKDFYYRYKRGVLFYLRDAIVVGVALWNIPPMEGFVAVATEILRAKPSYEEVGVLAELLGFDSALCTYPTPEEIETKQSCLVGKEW